MQPWPRKQASPRSGCRQWKLACRSSELQEFLGVLAVDLVLVRGRKAHFVDQVHTLLLEHEQRRGIGAEDEAVGPDRLEGAARRGRMIAGRFQVHHLEVLARRL